jgi:hypothetical protein
MTNKISDTIKIGQRINNLSIEKILDKYYIEPTSGKKSVKILVRCDCGEVFEMVGRYIFRKGQHCKKCRYNERCVVKIGEVYDKLTIINFQINKNIRYAVCQCECGKIVNKLPSLLKNKNITNNCGCTHRGGWQGYGEISKSDFLSIKNGAKSRGLEFKISIEYLWDLFLKQQRKCALSGVLIEFGFKRNDLSTASLDRIDSAMGYIEGNVQWVHKKINIMKMQHSQEHFIYMCKLVSDYNKRKSC